MRQAIAVSGEDLDEGPVRSKFMLKIFLVFAAIAALASGASFGGKWLGAELALAGYTDDPSLREIVIGNNVIAAPANMIRFERARLDGVTNRLDLYMRWPLLDGYTADARDDFNDADGKPKILFLAFEPRMMSRDMSGRFEPIYSSLIVKPGRPALNELTVYDFTKQSGYLNEQLVVAPRGSADPFVARCLSGPSVEESLAPCERDIQLGDNLSLTYRFPKDLLEHWQALDAAVTAKATGLLKTAR